MRGTTSVELLLAVLILIYISVAAYKATAMAGEAYGKDNLRASLASIAAHRIVSTAEILDSSPPGTRIVLELYVPEDVNLSCSAGSDKLKVRVKTSMEYDTCGGKICDRTIKMPLKCHKNWKSRTGRQLVALAKIGSDRVKIGVPT